MNRKLRPVGEVETNDFLDTIAGISAPKTTAKEKSEKMITLTPPVELRRKIDELVSWKQKEKEAQAEKSAREGDIIDFCKEKQDADGFSNNFQKSYRVQGVDSQITYVSSDKFSAIKSDMVSELEESLGKKFSELIEKKFSISLKDEVMRDSNLQKELMETFKRVYGDSYKEKFGIFFKSEVVFVPVDGFDRKLFSLPKRVVEKVRDLVKQAKPSLK